MHQFKLGDIVALKSACAATLGQRTPVPFMVVELITQTCPGGTQFKYKVSSGTHAGQALDIELLPWDSADVRACFVAAQKLPSDWSALADILKKEQP